MRPLKLTMQAFGPYKGCETVDFAKLSSQGLFLICGETGSGKTMILDAMTFALYGRSSGNLRDDFEALRYKGSAREVPTLVRFEFLHNGSIYAFERRLDMRRVNLAASQNVYKLEELEDGTELWEPLFENCRASDVETKAVELTGLKYDQFRQVIVLPQGQFERFLVSNSDDKEKILSCIFGVDKWQKIAENMYSIAKERYDGLKADRDDIESRLKDENCASVEELRSLTEGIQKELEAVRAERRAFEYEKKRGELENGLKLADRFGELHRLEGEMAKHKADITRYKKQQEGLALAEKADTLRPVIDLRNETVKIARERAEEAEQAEFRASGARKEALRASNIYEAVAGRKNATEADKALKTTLEGKREIYTKLDSLKRDTERCLSDVRVTGGELKLAQESFEASEKRVTAQNMRYVTAKERHSELLGRYIAGISGILAEKLVEGAPCPVCGSPVHPAPALKAGEAPSEEEVDSAKKKENFEYEELRKAMEDSTSAKGRLDAARDKAQKALLSERLANQALEDARKGLVDGIASKEELEKRISSLERSIANFEAELSKADKNKNDTVAAESVAVNSLKTAVAEREKAENNRVNAVQNLEKAIYDAGFGNEEEAGHYIITDSQKKVSRDFIVKYEMEGRQLEEGISKLREELKERTEPEPDYLKNEMAVLEKQRDSYNSREDILRTRLEPLSRKLEALEKIKKNLDASWKQAEDDMTVTKNLRGDTGVGLQRYVLSVMFRSVLHEANRMLESVHGGRYRLFTTDEKVRGTNKRGLDLKVADAYYDGEDGRAVTTLSGGEKFLVSLALSIGMSAVASKGGIRIEAMFIDEGFGSLDSDSIEDAISVLNRIRSANGMVGIISHVQLLQDTIPSKLLVHKSREGSTITETVG